MASGQKQVYYSHSYKVKPGDARGAAGDRRLAVPARFFALRLALWVRVPYNESGMDGQRNAGARIHRSGALGPRRHE